MSIWNSAIKPDNIGLGARGFLRSAVRAGADDKILSFCSALRANRQNAKWVLEVELRTLFKYNALDRARCAFNDFIASAADERAKQSARVMFSMFLIGMGEVESVELRPDKLPPVEDVTAEEGEAVAHILGSGDSPRLAVNYAYALFRRFPNSKSAYRAVIRSFLFDSTKRVDIPTPSIVEADTAVCIQEGNEPEQWWIIEDNQPDPARHEISTSHELARKLIENRAHAHESVTLRRGDLQERKATIKAILHKTVRRLHECLKDWDVHFPDDPFIVRVSVKKESEEGFDFTPVFRSLDRREEGIRNLEKICREHNLPVLSLAQATGATLIDTFVYAGSSRRMQLRACLGNKEERDAAVELVKNCKGVVLAPSALATLYITGAYVEISHPELKMFVTRGALGDLKRWLIELRTKGHTAGMMSKVQGQYVFVEASADECERRVRSVSTFIDWIERSTEVVDGTGLLSLPSKTCEELIDSLGRPFIEAVGVANERGLLLWEDEYVLGLVAHQQFNVHRVWTQAVASALCEFYGKSTLFWNKLTIGLLQLHFDFTSINVTTIHHAGSEAGWQPQRTPLIEVIDYLANIELLFEDRVRCWTAIVRAAWSEAGAGEASQITRETLERIDMLPGGRGMIHAFRDNIYKIFQDSYTATLVWGVIWHWLNRKPRESLRWNWW